ncbi:MAG: hypothetical protein ACLR4E_01345 [Gemmiger formicilis]|uniref:hypothetical protein n=1 Tax=Gemmiger formicilis TaxID=745368 RepID=UPI003A2CA6B5
MAHFCKNCGLLTAPYDERCPKCGAPLPHIPMGEALLESMRQSPEGTVETGEPLYEQDPARRRLARAYLIRALVVAGLVILFVAVAAMVFTAALHSQLAYYYYR